jgi:hypothetical protein
MVGFSRPEPTDYTARRRGGKRRAGLIPGRGYRGGSDKNIMGFGDTA